mgnify:CR=1 FL=1
MTAPSFSLMMDSGEARRFRQFQQDQDRARERVALLEREAEQFTAAGEVVPAAARRRNAAIVRYLWALDEEKQTDEHFLPAFRKR